ncbi:cysteine desulfurase family protein [Sphingobacterium lactis]|uniref:cysteine desulfurase n=1 Tax=Sphingobacterium lactis TaxID=797291 RepID=A0A1H5TW79_9SPHI|nr:cysteine desulfurase family protein [Sphingobacterium lactis]SEF67010.1 cysteine desulfurase [Sphingobacterium lactis]
MKNNIRPWKYLDNASTTKIREEVLKEMIPFFNEFYFNASSNHRGGRRAKAALDDSRGVCADLINASRDEIIFTSGSTESINYVLKGYLEENFEKGNHIITCKTEHTAVLKTCEYLETKGVEVSYLDVNSNGLIDLKELERAIKSETALIAIMFANNETGVIQDIKAIGDIAHKYNIKFFCDATQAIGKVAIDVNKLGIDMLCMSAHKIDGPKGIGFLYVKNGINLTPLIHGGAQENNNRAGTYNIPLIVGLAKACEIAKNNLLEYQSYYKTLFNHIMDSIDEMDNIKLIGDGDSRLFNIINLKIKEFDASIFVESSDDFAVSNGSACTSRIIEGSHVLKAMGLSDKDCNECIRLSFNTSNTIIEIDEFLKKVINA